MNRTDQLASRGVISRAAADKLSHDVTVYIVRHGATKLNNQVDTSVDRIRAWLDVPLVEEGREEARKAAAKLRGKGIGAIVSSDLDRARETAEIIGGILKIKPTFTMKLRPWDLGKFTGKSTKESLPEIEIYARDKPDQAVPQGESFNKFRDRAFEGFHEAVRAHPGETVACVTHHRDEMLMLAWDADGQPASHEVDIDKLLQKGDPPGGVHKLTTTIWALHGLFTAGQVGLQEAMTRDCCGACKAYLKPHGCKKVDAKVDSDDWCKVGVSKTDGHRFDPDGPKIEAS
jgi:broad specificity phosphatase PhoE